MQLRHLFSLVFFCASCTVNASEIEEFVKAKKGAEPVAYDENGAPIYKLIDLEPRFHNSEAASPMVYQGTKSVDGEFPEVGFLGFCTATAVGPKLIYTAAHCINNGQRVNYSSRADGKKYPATCYKHPDYNDRTVFNDYAFCILDGTFPSDTIFASFDIATELKAGDEVLLNGYGAPNLGTHYWGKANVKGISGQDIVTDGPANLGGGDSGGAFLFWTIFRTEPDKHLIFGTNSRAGGGRSYFNRVNHPNFKPFADSMSTKANSFICGVNKDCRQPIDPKKCRDEQKFVNILSTEKLRAEDALKLCREG